MAKSAYLPEDPPIRRVELDAIISSLGRAYQLSEPPARQLYAPPSGAPPLVRDAEERPKVAEYPCAVADFAFFPDTVEPECASAV